MTRQAISFLAGIATLLALPSLPGVGTVGGVMLALLAASVAMACRALARARPPRYALLVPPCNGVAWNHCAGLAVITAWAGAGFALAWIQACSVLRDRWPEELADHRVRAEIIVDGIPERSGVDWLFDAQVNVIAPLRLASSKTFHARIIARESVVTPKAGERWQLMLSLQPPRARLNPGAVDMERHYFHDRIHASGVVVPSQLNMKMDSGHHPLTALRERIAQRIEERVIDRDAVALITALAVGVTGSLSHEQWRVFNVTGTTHLIAISGLHVTMFALVALTLSRRLWTMGCWKVVPWPREGFASVLGFAAATAYSVLAGFSVPTQRTLIMLGAWLWARSIARVSAPTASLAVALVLILALDPFAVLSAGFWLSFGAMATIIFVTSTRPSPRTPLHEAVAVQAAVSVGLIPMTLASFGSISIAGPLVNALAIPVISWILVPLILLAVIFMPIGESVSNALLKAAEYIHNLSWPWLARAADNALAVLYVTPPVWWYAAASAGIIICLMAWPLRVRIAVVLWLIPLAYSGRHLPPRGGSIVTFLDSGESSSVVVRSAGRTVVYDTGDGFGTEGRAAERVLIPFLRSQGVHEVDMLVLTRHDAYSAAGVTALIAAMPVHEVVDAEAWPEEMTSLAARWKVTSQTTSDHGAIEFVLDDSTDVANTPRGARSEGAIWRYPPPSVLSPGRYSIAAGQDAH